MLVLGLGATGFSAARWLAAQQARVTVADTRHTPPFLGALAEQLPHVPFLPGSFRRDCFERCDLIVASPGVPLETPEVADAARRGVPIVGDVELFARALNGLDRRPKILAITGSNGKSTVTELAGAMCVHAGLRTVVAGNIGLPVLDALDQAQTADVVVLELSSFQLETVATLRPTAAAVLNISEDHLDRYADIEAYAAAKARILEGAAAQILNRQDARVTAMARRGAPIITFGADEPRTNADYGLRKRDAHWMLMQGDVEIVAADALRIAGLHNAVNGLAALALCNELGVSREAIVEALRTFPGLPHRVQFVAEIRGLRFYDDSKGTNVGATIAALSGLPGKNVVILGGEGKGQDFEPLAPALAAHARGAVLIGRDAPIIEAAVRGATEIVRTATLEEAVQAAVHLAQPGDAVLLSPACASFDMFKNYEHRAQVFVAAVKALEDRVVNE